MDDRCRSASGSSFQDKPETAPEVTTRVRRVHPEIHETARASFSYRKYEGFGGWRTKVTWQATLVIALQRLTFVPSS
jgi:hypothetical protein